MKRTKECNRCKKSLRLDEFRRKAAAGDGRDTRCKQCRKVEYRRYYNGLSSQAPAVYIRRLLRAAKSRAEERGVPFDLEESDISIPEQCPVFGFDLVSGSEDFHNSPTLDRIFPELGYVPGNVIVVSMRANYIKNNADIDELEDIVRFYRSLIGAPAFASSRNSVLTLRK